MVFPKWQLGTLILLSLGLDQATAQDQLDSSSVFQGGQIQEWIVSAQRMPYNRAKAPYAFQMVDTTTLRERQIGTSADATWSLPGVFLQKTNLGGGSPIIRGLMGNQIVLMYDGVRLNNSTYRYGPNQYLNTINVWDVGQIELLHGGTSVQFGSDALGGTIHLRSEEMNFTTTSQVHSKTVFRIGSQQMEQSGFHKLQFSNKHVSLSGSTTLRQFGDLFGGKPTGLQSPSGYSEMDYNFRARIQFSSKLQVSFLTQKVRQTDVDVFHKVQLEQFEINKMALQARELSYLKFTLTPKSKWLYSTNLTIHRQATDEIRLSRKKLQQVLRTEQDKVGTMGVSLETQAVFLKNSRSNFGVEFYSDLVESSRQDDNYQNLTSEYKRGLYPNNSVYSVASMFVLNDYFWKKTHISVGARYHHTLLSVQETSADKIVLDPSALVGYFMINHPIQPGLWLNGSVGSSFRAPNVDDLSTLGIVDFRYEVPNFNLMPEHSFQQQLGLRLERGPFIFSAFLYQNNLTNLIERVKVDTQPIQGYPVYSKVNLGKALIRGFEMTISYQPQARWQLKGTLTSTYGQNVHQDEPMRRIPPIFSTFSGQYSFNKHVLLAIEGIVAGQQKRLSTGDLADNRIPTGGTPGWAVIHLHSTFHWKHVELQISVRNLANKDYRSHGSGINGVGRSLWSTLSIGF